MCLGLSKINAFEEFHSLRTDVLLWSLLSLTGLYFALDLLGVPLWSQSLLPGWKVGEAFSVITKPKEELKVLCCVFNEDKIVQKVTGCAWLYEMGWSTCVLYIRDNCALLRLTGQVSLLMIRSKASESGTPRGRCENPEEPSGLLLKDGASASPLIGGLAEATWRGRR